MPKEILIPLQGDIDERRRFLDEVVDLVKDSFYESQDEQRTTKVLNYLSPEEIRAKLDTRIYDDGVGFSGIVESIPSILKYSLKTSHPRFLSEFDSTSEKKGKKKERKGCHDTALFRVYRWLLSLIVQFSHHSEF